MKMKMKISTYLKGTLIALLWTLSLNMAAQNITVKGRVTDV
jgi:hypothetical protein